jgi:hypothetical protein
MPAAEQCALVQQDDNGHAVLTAKFYCTLVCFADLFQAYLCTVDRGLKDTSGEGAVASSGPINI